MAMAGRHRATNAMTERSTDTSPFLFISSCRCGVSSSAFSKYSVSVVLMAESPDYATGNGAYERMLKELPQKALGFGLFG